VGTRSGVVVAATILAWALAIAPAYLDGDCWVPATGQHVNWATASNQPTTISFDPVTSTSVRLRLISPHPNESNGFFQIAELEVP
jgi:beta-galactosidase